LIMARTVAGASEWEAAYSLGVTIGAGAERQLVRELLGREFGQLVEHRILDARGVTSRAVILCVQVGDVEEDPLRADAACAGWSLRWTITRSVPTFMRR